MIEDIGALAYQAGTVPRHCFDEALDEFLAELLHDLRCAPGEETCGVTHGGIGTPSAVNDSPQPIEHIGACGRSGAFGRTTAPKSCASGLLARVVGSSFVLLFRRSLGG